MGRALRAIGSIGRDVPVKTVLLGLVLVALLISVPFGGMRPAAAPDKAAFIIGKPIEVAPVTVTVTGARHGQDIGAAAAPATKGRYLVVLAKVSTDEPIAIARNKGLTRPLDDLVRLRGIDGLLSNEFDPKSVVKDSLKAAPTAILVLEDGTEMGSLARGLTYNLAFFFLQAPGHDPAPDSLDVVLQSHTLRANSYDGEEMWLDPTIAAEAVVPASPFIEASDTSGGGS